MAVIKGCHLERPCFGEKQETTGWFPGKGPKRRPHKRLGRRFEEVAKAVWGSYCQLPMPLKLALAVRETAAGHRLGALEEWGGCTSPPFQCIPGGGGGACTDCACPMCHRVLRSRVHRPVPRPELEGRRLQWPRDMLRWAHRRWRVHVCLRVLGHRLWLPMPVGPFGRGTVARLPVSRGGAAGLGPCMRHPPAPPPPPPPRVLKDSGAGSATNKCP